jgi:hypothetical protein
MSAFAKPWQLVEHEESFEIASANGRILAYVYFEDEAGRRDVTKRMAREDARRLAIEIQRLPETLAELKQLRAAKDEPGRRDVTRRMAREDARRLAIQIQRLPETLAELKQLRAAKDEPA